MNLSNDAWFYNNSGPYQHFSNARFRSVENGLPVIRSSNKGISAIIDNIPIVYAVLTAHPSMDMGQWLLITLTAGTGGSLLSIGSAAGVALMGQARGVYTFFAHLKWAWAILLGYAACIGVHLLMNQHLFDLIPLER